MVDGAHQALFVRQRKHLGQQRAQVGAVSLAAEELIKNELDHPRAPDASVAALLGSKDARPGAFDPHIEEEPPLRELLKVLSLLTTSVPRVRRVLADVGLVNASVTVVEDRVGAGSDIQYRWRLPSPQVTEQTDHLSHLGTRVRPRSDRVGSGEQDEARFEGREKHSQWP